MTSILKFLHDFDASLLLTALSCVGLRVGTIALFGTKIWVYSLLRPVHCCTGPVHLVQSRPDVGRTGRSPRPLAVGM